jgi:3,4-dihydroxy 2-butanone 4-phosphate synthase / GTP cyclohydrolase II
MSPMVTGVIAAPPAMVHQPHRAASPGYARSYSHARARRVEQALVRLAAGAAVVLIDDTGPDSEGDLVVAAELADTAAIAFLVRHGSGFLNAAMTVGDCQRLGLPPMHATHTQAGAPAYTVSVDAGIGIGTGISAADRATTMRVLAGAASRAEDLVRPGHVVPLCTVDGGVIAHGGRAEAAVDLVRAAGLRPVAATCAVVSTYDPVQMAAAAELRQFAAEHDLAAVSITDLIDWHTHTPPTFDHRVRRPTVRSSC